MQKLAMLVVIINQAKLVTLLAFHTNGCNYVAYVRPSVRLYVTCRITEKRNQASISNAFRDIQWRM